MKKDKKSLFLHFFDEFFYLSQVKNISKHNALEHYLREGWKLGFDPAPHFCSNTYLEDYPDVKISGINPLEHYIFYGLSEQRQAKPSKYIKDFFSQNKNSDYFLNKYYLDEKIFNSLEVIMDCSYYNALCKKNKIPAPDEVNVNETLHFISIGRFFKISISPIFNIDYYLSCVEKSDLPAIFPEEAIIHYFTIGEQKGLKPCVLFNPTFYKVHYNTQNSSPLIHYFVHGSVHDFDPSALFWSKWYKKNYNISTSNTLLHFYSEGIYEGYCPNSLIDLEWYKQKNMIPSRLEAALHYFNHGINENLSPFPLIDTDHIFKQLKDKEIILEKQENIFEKYLEYSQIINPHHLFDTNYYIKFNNHEENIIQPLDNYIKSSLKFPKKPNPFFSDHSYYKSRPDVRNAKAVALIHYLSSGYLENVTVHPLIDHNFLRDNLPTKFNKSPLEILVSNPNKFSKFLRKVSQDKDDKNRSKWNPIAINIEKTAENYSKINLKNVKVGIFAHVFYPELLKEVVDFASNAKDWATLFITTDNVSKQKIITEYLNNNYLNDWEVRVCKNQGRDIMPSFLGFADRMQEVEYGVHIHTKQSFHYGQPFGEWRRYLFEENGATRLRIESILKIFSGNPTLGALAPIDFAPIRKLISWGYNFQIVKGLLELAGWEKPLDEISLEFPSGSMFWFRTKALSTLYNAGLQIAHFDQEKGQIDGTLAHAIERAFFLLIEVSGYDWARFCSNEKQGGYCITNNIDYARTRLLPHNKRIDLIEKNIPETSSFYCQAINNPKIRLNLILPTCDVRLGYAGVSEAIRQFRAIADALGDHVDVRIIATDVGFDNMTMPPRGFVLSESLLDDKNMIVVPGYFRGMQPLSLRENDYFVVSAWWNAKQAFDLLQVQKNIYGLNKKRRVVYLIQDFEPNFYPWSTRWALAENTYRHCEETIAVYNTPILYDFMKTRYQFSSTFIYKPMINEKLLIPTFKRLPYYKREKIVLLYARPHAERNCIEMLDAIVSSCIESNPSFWQEWRFCAIGESFNNDLFSCEAIEVLGRLDLNEYRNYLNISRLGICLMVSPHPSYPPLEMAANGVHVLANTYENKDLSKLHENIESFNHFDPVSLSKKLEFLASKETWNEGKPLINWFFEGKNNLADIAQNIAAEIKIGLMPNNK